MRNYRKSGVGNSEVILLANLKPVPSSHSLFCSFFPFEGQGGVPITWVFSYSVHLSWYVYLAVVQIYWSRNDWYHILNGCIQVWRETCVTKPLWCVMYNECMLLMEWLCCDVISGAAHGSCESKVNWKPAGLGILVVKINRVLWNWDSLMATWDCPN